MALRDGAVAAVPRSRGRRQEVSVGFGHREVFQGSGGGRFEWVEGRVRVRK